MDTLFLPLSNFWYSDRCNFEHVTIAQLKLYSQKWLQLDAHKQEYEQQEFFVELEKSLMKSVSERMSMGFVCEQVIISRYFHHVYLKYLIFKYAIYDNE